jgi:hypothetical protein
LVFPKVPFPPPLLYARCERLCDGIFSLLAARANKEYGLKREASGALNFNGRVELGSCKWEFFISLSSVWFVSQQFFRQGKIYILGNLWLFFVPSGF